MRKFSIKIDEASLLRNKRGLVTGRIYIVAGDIVFPHQEWDDFIVVILGWWIEAIQTLHNGETESAYLRFMDGPYHIQITANDKKAINMEFIDTHDDKGLVGTSPISIEELYGAVQEAASEIAAIAKRNKWEDSDMAQLQKLVATPINLDVPGDK